MGDMTEPVFEWRPAPVNSEKLLLNEIEVARVNWSYPSMITWVACHQRPFSLRYLIPDKVSRFYDDLGVAKAECEAYILEYCRKSMPC